MKIGVVTGAATGIGEAIAERLIEGGAHVIALDRDATGLEATAKRLGEHYEPVVGDVGDWDAHERAAAAAEATGTMTWWVNNAGIDVTGAAHEVMPEDILAGLRVLLVGAMYGGAVAVRHMLPARAGAIVNMSSIQGIAAYPRYYVYETAKAGVIMATKSIALDYAPFGIRCNAVLPGSVETPMTYETLDPTLPVEEALRREGLGIPMLRIGQPREIAEVVAFLLSDQASYMTGSAVVADGGSTTRVLALPSIDVRDDV